MVHTQFLLAKPKSKTCWLRNRSQRNDSRKLRRHGLRSLLRSTGPSAIAESSPRASAVARPFVTPPPCSGEAPGGFECPSFEWTASNVAKLMVFQCAGRH